MKTQLASPVKAISAAMIIDGIDKPGKDNGVLISTKDITVNYLRNVCADRFKVKYTDRSYSVNEIPSKKAALVYWTHKESQP